MVEQPVEFAATGRRKTAVARVRLALGVGKRLVNGVPMEEYFPSEAMRIYIEEPLAITSNQKRYDVAAVVKGGGKAGQAGAVRHGISRALVQAEPGLRDKLKDSGMLTRDPRMKERKKSGQPGARKRFQFSKR
ncbi:MAG TPA: 30S ribosomal protein S9 [Kiritimatiellae bacterium]|nr:30S ribosomal protein S9 [Kiritimatiellia bacterium]